MFADQSLTPKEATRLCALGLIAGGPMRYSALAQAVRDFTSHVMGPSLDLLGNSVELLRYEGLLQARDEGQDGETDPAIEITPAGRRELQILLTARLRPQSDLSKLVIALKIRFLHLLAPAERLSQLDLLADTFETELNRLTALRDTETDSYLGAWLDHEIESLGRRVAWLDSFAQSVREDEQR
jgi:DNA-binding PadR family transcriptional regulator